MPAGLPLRFAAAFCLLAVGAHSGCAQHRIPAIDPTGEHLFSGTTTLATHDLFHLPHFGKHHAPAVIPAAAPAAVVPVKPPCTPPVEVIPVVPQPVITVPVAPAVPVVPIVPVACGPQPAVVPQNILPGKPQPGGPICPPDNCNPPGPELTITPARIVAPVCTEVVLAAGLCCPNGYYVMRQPLEWMLAQDGVGQIVAVGKESPRDVSLLIRDTPQKLATNYARAHTSTISQVLDRGTASPIDDVYLNRGQSWISITSPTEGASHVVVWAPKENNWDRRKATATIYWVDSAWRFPPAVTARAGARQTLTTLVTRSNGQPVSGWLVHYDVLEGPPAAFSNRGETSIDARTDAAGRATVELLPRSVDPGITAVRVQIIRPATSADQPQMIIGQGTTSVQWTTPGLSIRAMGTSAVMADGAIGYRVEVTNNGDLLTRGVELSYAPPPGVTVLNSNPAAQIFGQRFQWRLGDLAPRSTSVVEVNCRAAVTASIRSCFRVTSADQLTAEHCVNTDVRTNALSVKMTGPDVVEVGREAKFNVDVTNLGQTALTNITATDTFDPGLAHSGGERSPVIRTLAQPLAPGQSDRFAISLIVTQPGRQCHRLDVTADGGHTASARACITGTQPAATPPQVSVRITGPANQRAGEIAQYNVELKNNGSGAATNVVLSVTWGVNQQFDQATRDHEDDFARLTTRWRIVQLAGGQTVTRQLNLLCLNPDPSAIVRATATSQQTAAIMSEAFTVITGGAAGPAPPGGRVLPGTGAAGNLKISAVALANPIMVGAVTTYSISVANERAVGDRDVAVTIQLLDDGLSFTRTPVLSSPSRALRSGGNSIEFEPVRELRPSEELAPFSIQLQGVKAGRHKLRVTVTSGLSPTGVIAESETTVNMP
jgi:uncharacterized repeat protein (TIGR01451 family)